MRLVRLLTRMQRDLLFSPQRLVLVSKTVVKTGAATGAATASDRAATESDSDGGRGSNSDRGRGNNSDRGVGNGVRGGEGLLQIMIRPEADYLLGLRRPMGGSLLLLQAKRHST